MVRTSVRPSHFHFFLFPAVVSQNVTNKSCLACVKSEKYASWVTNRPQWDCCCRGEAKVRIINFKTTWSEFQMPSQTAPAEVRILNFKTTWSEFHHLPRFGPKQLWASAHLGCTREASALVIYVFMYNIIICLLFMQTAKVYLIFFKNRIFRTSNCLMIFPFFLSKCIFLLIEKPNSQHFH